MHAFYADRFVRKRLTGFSGDRTPGTAPAAYSTHTDGFLLVRGEHLAPGDGSIDWLWVIGRLRRVRSHGGLVLELSSGDHEPVEEFLARAVRCGSLCRGCARVDSLAGLRLDRRHENTTLAPIDRRLGVRRH